MTHLLLPSTVTQKLLIIQASYCRITKLRARLTPKCKKLNIRKCGIVPGFCRSGHFIIIRRIDNWNTNLPSHIVNTDSINSFKNFLDKYYCACDRHFVVAIMILLINIIFAGFHRHIAFSCTCNLLMLILIL